MVLATSSRAVIWHDLECGGYRADLGLWHELAGQAADGRAAARVLDIGAGSGRVSLELARAGHEVTALDREASLLEALDERAVARGGAPVRTVVADARDFRLPERDFDLCLVPMQTIQLLAGSRERLALMRRAREHLRPSGLLACAIVTAIEAFEYSEGGWAPVPERALIGACEYVSQPVGVRVGRRGFTIDRERIVREGGEQLARERDVAELAWVSAARLLREGERAGLAGAGTLTIPATDEHVGSEVVVLRA